MAKKEQTLTEVLDRVYDGKIPVAAGDGWLVPIDQATMNRIADVQRSGEHVADTIRRLIEGESHAEQVKETSKDDGSGGA